jgi:FMN reductase
MSASTNDPRRASPLRLLGIAGSTTPASKTRLLVAAALTRVDEQDLSVSTELLALADEPLVFCDGRDPADYTGATRRAIDQVLAADAVILGSPLYRGSYPGALKNLFDVLPNDALEGKTVGLIASGGTDHHYLALEHELRPLLAFFRAHVLPGSVWARNEDFADGRLVSAPVSQGLGRLAADVVAHARALPRPVVGADGPSIPRRALVDG